MRREEVFEDIRIAPPFRDQHSKELRNPVRVDAGRDHVCDRLRIRLHLVRAAIPGEERGPAALITTCVAVLSHTFVSVHRSATPMFAPVAFFICSTECRSTP